MESPGTGAQRGKQALGRKKRDEGRMERDRGRKKGIYDFFLNIKKLETNGLVFSFFVYLCILE